MRKATAYDNLSFWLAGRSRGDWFGLGLTILLLSAFIALDLSKVDDHCLQDQLQLQIELDQSDHDFSTLGSADLKLQCTAYRHRLSLIVKAAALARRCGANATGRAAPDWWASNQTQQNFFDQLIHRKCTMPNG